MASYRYASRPSVGDAIAFDKGILSVPQNPVIPFVEGDGTGADNRPATRLGRFKSSPALPR